MKRTQEVRTQRVPQAQLCRDPAVEERADIGAVGSFWSRREAEELDRREPFDQPAICGGLSMVELIDDDDREGIRLELVRIVGGQRLDAANMCRQRSGRSPPTYSSPKFASLRTSR